MRKANLFVEIFCRKVSGTIKGTKACEIRWSLLGSQQRGIHSSNRGLHRTTIWLIIFPTLLGGGEIRWRWKKVENRETTSISRQYFCLCRRFSQRFVAEKKPGERTPGASTSASTSLDPDTPSSSTTTSSPPWLRLFLFLPFAHPSQAHPPTSLG